MLHTAPGTRAGPHSSKSTQSVTLRTGGTVSTDHAGDLQLAAAPSQRVSRAPVSQGEEGGVAAREGKRKLPSPEAAPRQSALPQPPRERRSREMEEEEEEEQRRSREREEEEEQRRSREREEERERRSREREEEEEEEQRQLSRERRSREREEQRRSREREEEEQRQLSREEEERERRSREREEEEEEEEQRQLSRERRSREREEEEQRQLSREEDEQRRSREREEADDEEEQLARGKGRGQGARLGSESQELQRREVHGVALKEPLELHFPESHRSWSVGEEPPESSRPDPRKRRGDWRNRINRKQEAGVTTTAAAVMADTSAPLWESERNLRKVNPVTSDALTSGGPRPPLLRGSVRLCVKEVWGEGQTVFSAAGFGATRSLERSADTWGRQAPVPRNAGGYGAEAARGDMDRSRTQPFTTEEVVIAAPHCTCSSLMDSESQSCNRWAHSAGRRRDASGHSSGVQRSEKRSHGTQQSGLVRRSCTAQSHNAHPCYISLVPPLSSPRASGVRVSLQTCRPSPQQSSGLSLAGRNRKMALFNRLAQRPPRVVRAKTPPAPAEETPDTDPANHTGRYGARTSQTMSSDGLTRLLTPPHSPTRGLPRKAPGAEPPPLGWAPQSLALAES
ncbi:unnamed protein product [Arctogadus glacialis]